MLDHDQVPQPSTPTLTHDITPDWAALLQFAEMAAWNADRYSERRAMKMLIQVCEESIYLAEHKADQL